MCELLISGGGEVYSSGKNRPMFRLDLKREKAESSRGQIRHFTNIIVDVTES